MIINHCALIFLQNTYHNFNHMYLVVSLFLKNDIGTMSFSLFLPPSFLYNKHLYSTWKVCIHGSRIFWYSLSLITSEWFALPSFLSLKQPDPTSIIVFPIHHSLPSALDYDFISDRNCWFIFLILSNFLFCYIFQKVNIYWIKS